MDGRMIDKPAFRRNEAGARRAATALSAVLAVVVGLSGAAAPAGAQEGGAQAQAAQLEILGKRSNELFEQGKYAEALAAAEEWAKAVEQDETAKGKPGAATANALNSVAWTALFARRFERALEAADRAAALAPADLFIQGNRAHALMFMGRKEDALSVYVGHKGEAMSKGRTWEDVAAQDLAEFQKHGLESPLMARVKDAMAAAPESPKALLGRANALISNDNNADALPMVEKYMESVKVRQGDEHPDYAEALRAQEKALKGLQRFAEAEAAIRRALAIDEKAFGSEAFPVLADLNTLAMLLEEKNRLAEAAPLHRRALAIGEKLYGPDNSTVAILLGNLASLLQETDQLAEAEHLKRRALAINEKSFGPDHPNVATSLNNLASLLEATNRRAEAEPLYRRALAIDEKALGPDHPDVATGLSNLGLFLKRADRFAEAEPLHRRALAIDEKKYGPNHPNIAIRLGNLSALLHETNRLAEAELLYRRALAIDEQSYGPDHRNVALRLNNLAVLLEETNRAAEAEALVRRALAIHEKSYGPEHSQVARNLGNLAVLLQKANRLAEAEPLYRRALTITEKIHGPDHPKTAVRLGHLASFLYESDRFAEAEPLMRRALAIDEKSYGLDHSEVATRLNILAALLVTTGRFSDAEPLYRRALAIREKVYGPDHPSVSTSLNNLALLLKETDRFTEAEAALRRAVSILEKAHQEHPDLAASLGNLAGLFVATNRLAESEPLMRRALALAERIRGPEHPSVARDLNNLAALLVELKRYSEAEPLYRRSLAIHEKSYGPEHSSVATSLNNLALLLRKLDRLADAEPAIGRALAIDEKIYGSDHPSVAIRLLSLGALHRDNGRLGEAEPLMRRALAIDEKRYGPDHPDVATILGSMTWLRAKQGNWSGAFEAARRSSAIRLASAGRMRGAGGEKRQMALNSEDFREHVALAFRVGRGNLNIRDEAFAMAQRIASSEAAGALAQAAARFANGSDALATLAREQQDLARQSEAFDKRLLAALGKADNAAAEAVRAEQARIEGRLKEIAAQLEKDHPDYVALLNPEPLTVAQTRALLAPDEAFVQFLDVTARPHSPIPETAFAFVITRTEARWLELPLGATALTDKVTALRCGLDTGAWKDASNTCAQLLGAPQPSANDLPPFDLGRAHDLYRDLFGQAEDVIKDKRLLIAPSGALTRLPFQVLVTEAPEASAKGADAYAKAKWLGARNAISVLPSAASLKLLRMGGQGLGKQGSASDPASRDPFLGFGNPLIDAGGRDRSAWSRQACSKTATPQSARRSANRAAPPALSEVYRGATADVELLRRATPLPETADELCAVARNLGAPDSAVYLGERATVSQIKALSASGALGRARTVHFATHGLMAAETALFVRNRAEPALLMTPPAPDKAAPEDDGLLKASDVTGLKLNADWVVMSACNTASGGEGGEALSGLARAFFYAGARSMLVSHWYVDSAAAVEITTGAFSSLKADPDIGRDEALRRSLVSLIAKGGDNAHPSVWAPFVLVGDGGRTGSETGASGAATRRASLTDASRSAEPARTLKLEGANGRKISGLAFSPDGGQLLGTTNDGAVMVWDARIGASVGKLKPGGTSKIFGFSIDGRLLAAASSSRKEIALWDTQRDISAGAIRASAGARFSRDAAALSPDGRRLAAEQYGGPSSGASVGVWEAGGKRIGLLEGNIGDVHSLIFSPDGDRLAVIDAKGALSVCDARTGKAAFASIAAAGAMTAAFSSDGRLIATAGGGDQVKLWDARTGSRLGAIDLQDTPIAGLAFSPDGKWLALAKANDAVELHDASRLFENVSASRH